MQQRLEALYRGGFLTSTRSGIYTIVGTEVEILDGAMSVRRPYSYEGVVDQNLRSFFEVMEAEKRPWLRCPLDADAAKGEIDRYVGLHVDYGIALSEFVDRNNIIRVNVLIEYPPGQLPIRKREFDAYGYRAYAALSKVLAMQLSSSNQSPDESDRALLRAFLPRLVTETRARIDKHPLALELHRSGGGVRIPAVLSAQTEQRQQAVPSTPQASSQETEETVQPENLQPPDASLLTLAQTVKDSSLRQQLIEFLMAGHVEKLCATPAIETAERVGNILSMEGRNAMTLYSFVTAKKMLTFRIVPQKQGSRKVRYFIPRGLLAYVGLASEDAKGTSRRELAQKTKAALGDGLGSEIHDPSPSSSRVVESPAEPKSIVHLASEDEDRRGKIPSLTREQEEAAKKDSDKTENPEESGKEALAARPDEPISVAVKGSIPVISPEERELQNRTPDLDKEMEEIVRSFDKRALGDLLGKIPRSVSSVDFVRLGIPEYVAEVITFIYAVVRKELLTFDLSLVSEISYTTFRSAVNICHKYLEAYEHNQQTPVKDLLRLYRLMRVAAKDQIREQRMAVEISRELEE